MNEAAIAALAASLPVRFAVDEPGGEQQVWFEDNRRLTSGPNRRAFDASRVSWFYRKRAAPGL